MIWRYPIFVIHIDYTYFSMNIHGLIIDGNRLCYEPSGVPQGGHICLSSSFPYLLSMVTKGGQVNEKN